MVPFLLVVFLGSAYAKRLGGMDDFILVLQPNGQIYGSGANSNGQLGTGVTNAYPEYFPVQMRGVVNSSDLCAGKYHSCIVDSNRAECVGANSGNLLGDGTAEDKFSLTQVSGLDAQVAQVFCGERASCAVLSSGAARCWGGNQFGGLGDGTNTGAPVPVEVTGFEHGGAASIGIGSRHSCFLSVLGKVTCSGYNWYGQLGDNTIRNTYVPTMVGGIALSTTFVSVSCGASHSCAVTAAGTVYCWGWNAAGQLGVNSLFDHMLPRQVSRVPSGASSVWAVASSTFVLMKDGRVVAFGSNDHAQLGDGTEQQAVVPVPFAPGATHITEVRGGARLTCVLFPFGAVQCLGNNQGGGMGVGPDTPASLVLVSMQGLPPTPPTNSPTLMPTTPTKRPTNMPTPKPTKATKTPTPKPIKTTKTPTPKPTKPKPTVKATKAPTPKPTKPKPTTKRPTNKPTKPTKRQVTQPPSASPSSAPSSTPTRSPVKLDEDIDPAEDTEVPTSSPTASPSGLRPTSSPTASPNGQGPTSSPTLSPSRFV